MKKDFVRNAGNPFGVPPQGGTLSVEEADARLYGAVDVPVSGRIVSKPIDVMAIRADVRQPRRAVPAMIRLHWDGRAALVGNLLERWREVAEARGGIKIEPVKIINGLEGLEDIDQAPAIVQEYVALCRLAQSIHRDGLINPVSVIERGGEYLIETGERRWLAYQLLYEQLGDRYKSIPARISDGRDYIWRQAQENTARRQLNAISMARQLALLIMDARRDVDGAKYNEYEALVLSGECDRRYYAQVHNGTIHRIPRGMGERIESAMGLSRARINHYRSLLRVCDDDQINDALWIKADVEDWSEKAVREIVANVPVEVIGEIIKQPDWTLEDLRKRADMYTQVYISQQKEVGIPANPYVVPVGRAVEKAVVASPERRQEAQPVAASKSTEPQSQESVGVAAQVIGGRRLLHEGEDVYQMLAGVGTLCVMMGDDDLAADLLAVRNLTSAQIREQRGTIVDYLAGIYEGVNEKFRRAASAMDGYFAEIEQMVADRED